MKALLEFVAKVSWICTMVVVGIMLMCAECECETVSGSGGMRFPVLRLILTCTLEVIFHIQVTGFYGVSKSV